MSEFSVNRSPLLIPSVLYALLFVGAANAAIRPSPDAPITLWYAVFPFAIVTLALVSREFRNWTMWLVVLCAYGFVTGLAYGVPAEMIAMRLLKYAQLLAYMGLLSVLMARDEHARAGLMRLIVVLVMLVFLLAAIETATGIELPTIRSENSREYLEAYFFTANDVGLFLGAVVVLVLASRAHMLSKLALLIPITLLNWRNDAKAVILATVLALMMWILISACVRLRIRPLMAIGMFLLAVPLAVLVIVTQLAPDAEGDYSLLALLVDPVERVIRLEPYELGGSVFDRTDALIFNLQAFFSTYGLGLGPAGSIYTLSLPATKTLSAESMHNAVAELLVELGPMTLLLAIKFLGPAVRGALENPPSARTRARLLLLAALPMLSVSQSSGYISNYAFWLVAFVIWNTPDVPIRRRATAMTAISTANSHVSATA